MRWLNSRKRVLIGIAAFGFLALILFLISPRFFFTLLSLGGILMLLLSAFVMVATLRKAKSVSPLSLVTGIGLSVLVALIYPLLTGASPGVLLPLNGLFFGLMGGLSWGATTTVFIDKDVIRSRGNGWYLMIWALTLAIPQALALLIGRPPAPALWLLFFGTGLVVGQSGLTLFRFLLLKLKLASATPRLPENP